MALQDVDLMICQRLEIPSSTDEWVGDWYNIIGFSLAMGRSFDELIDRYKSIEDDEARLLILIAALLNENFYVSTWAER